MACFASNNISGLGINNLLINATYFIDSQIGDDSTAVIRDMSRPYRTIGAVLALMQPGEVIYVQPGVYSAPSLVLNNTIWYFSQGSVTTTNISGQGFVYGYGSFIGQSPAIIAGSGDLVFYAQIVTTPVGHAILINGPNRAKINIQYLYSDLGVLVNGACNCELNIDRFSSEGDFIRATSLSSGWFNCRIQYVECGVFMKSDSNSINMNFDVQNMFSYWQYMIDIDDPSANTSNTATYNFNISRVNCIGIIRSSGLASVSDDLLQPNINLRMQNVMSRNGLANPAIVCASSRVNISYESFGFIYFTPIPFMIIVENGGFLNIRGTRTYNADRINNGNVGFIQVSSGGFSAIRADFTDLLLTGQMLDCSGGGESQINIVRFDNNCQLPGSISCIINNAKCSVNIQKMTSVHPGESNIIVNNGDMQLDIGEWTTYSTDSVFVLNSARIQANIEYLMADGSNNTMINNNGFMMNLTAGEIWMNGNNCIGLTAFGPTFMKIGKILGNNNGGMGIRVQGSGQLFGHVASISTIDQTCIEHTGGEESDFTFGTLTSQSSQYIIYSGGSQSKINIVGGSIVSGDTQNPIYIVSQDSKLNLQIADVDIRTCDVGIYSQATNSDIRINIQNFNITGNARTAGIYSDKGSLYLEGNYYMQTSDPSPLISLNGESVFRSRLGFVSSSYMILNTKTIGDVWYEASESITRDFENNIFADLPDVGQKFTVKGLFRTSGDFNIEIGVCSPAFIRVINSVLVSTSRNIVSPGINIISNYSIGNAGLSGGIAVPPGGFVVDGAVQ